MKNNTKKLRRTAVGSVLALAALAGATTGAVAPANAAGPCPPDCIEREYPWDKFDWPKGVDIYEFEDTVLGELTLHAEALTEVLRSGRVADGIVEDLVVQGRSFEFVGSINKLTPVDDFSEPPLYWWERGGGIVPGHPKPNEGSILVIDGVLTAVGSDLRGSAASGDVSVDFTQALNAG